MARIRNATDIIQSLLQFYRVAQPALDTKPGTVSRDLLIDGPATQFGKLYDELSRIANLQSLRLAIGSDLDKLAQNFGAVRQTGSQSAGPALLTFNTLDADFAINRGDLVTAKNGSTFSVINSLTISTVLLASYKATAATYRADLDYVGITDQYAVQVQVQAAAPGTQGNISTYSLISSSTSGINNVTNVSPFGGGSGAETDAAFRSRILSVFSGANTGTALGYKNAVIANPSVIDALVIGPGNALMTRDGTQVSPSGIILKEGTGGKVDIIVFGTTLQEVLDSYIYHDLSNTGDPTNPANNYVLGQLLSDLGKTVTQKRLDDLASGTLPNQPVNNIVSVTGSISGPFSPKSVDAFGVISGNYELVRDTGDYANSSWGFDSLRWISNKISDLPEDKTKTNFNSQDPFSYPDVLQVSAVQDNKSIVNENSKVNPANRASIQLVHKSVTSVTRVFNTITGERYVVSNQNPDSISSSTNLTGRILISGKSLPAVTDILQVDYTWVFPYDPYFDFDNLLNHRNPRIVQDSLDWGFSNAVRREQATLLMTGSYLKATVTHPISTVVSVNIFATTSTNIILSSGRLAVVLPISVNNVISVVRISDGAELWATTANNGTFSGLTIFLPTDTSGTLQDFVSVVYNAVDIFNASTGNQGSFNANVITIIPSTLATAGTIVECNYLANVNTLLPSTLLPTLPAIRSGNSFAVGSGAAAQVLGCQPCTNIYTSVSGTIAQNLRQAPSQLGLAIAGTISPGTLTLTGTTLTLVANTVITVSTASLKQDLTSAIRQFLGLNSVTSIPKNIKLGRVVKVEQVITDNNNNVLSVERGYDLKGYGILDSSFVKDESVSINYLQPTEFLLPSTNANLQAVPAVSQKLRVSFYLITTVDTENVFFSKAGTLYTDKKFALVNTISISSGFSSGGSSAATLTVTNLNQPATRGRYRATYDYLAPKPNERITVDFNYQQIIATSTLAIENSRPIDADVLVKTAVPLLINVTLAIVVTSDFINTSATVVQNVQNAVTSALNAVQLGTTVDSSDLVNVAYSINGVDRVRVVHFNLDSATNGSVLSLTAQQNQFLVANDVIINIEFR